MHFFQKLLLMLSITAISVKAQNCMIPAKCTEGIPVDLTVTKSHEECLKHCQGGFQLADFIIMELKNHMTCYRFSPLIG